MENEVKSLIKTYWKMGKVSMTMTRELQKHENKTNEINRRIARLINMELKEDMIEGVSIMDKSLALFTDSHEIKALTLEGIGIIEKVTGSKFEYVTGDGEGQLRIKLSNELVEGEY